MTNVTRRSALKLAVGGFAAALPKEAKGQASSLSGFLSSSTFTDQNREAVLPTALANRLRGKNVIVSFTWDGCGDAHKEMHKTLSALEKTVDPDLVHVVIDVDATAKATSADLRKAIIRKELRNNGMGNGAGDNIILLVPDSVDDLPKIGLAAGFGQTPEPHDITAITLFGRNGNRIGTKFTGQSSTDRIVDSWRTVLQSSPVQQP